MHGETKVLKSIYASPYYVAFNAAADVLYYFFFRFVFSLSGTVLLLEIPNYMIYALALSASMLLTAGAYSVASALSGKGGISDGALSAATTAAGGVIASCGCQAPILGTLLYAVGFNAIAVSGVLAIVGTYQMLFFTVLIAINLLFLYYTLRRTASRLDVNPLRKAKVRSR